MPETPTLSPGTTVALWRRPLVLCIFSVGMSLGLILGKVLSNAPSGPAGHTKAKSQPVFPATSDSPSLNGMNGRTQAGTPNHAAPTSGALPSAPVVSRAQQDVEDFVTRYEIWRAGAEYARDWLPLDLTRELLGFGTRPDVAEIIPALRKLRPAGFYQAAVLTVWAERDPAAAWSCFLGRGGFQLFSGEIGRQFFEHMALHHWSVIENDVRLPLERPLRGALECWTARLRALAGDPVELRRVMTEELPEGKHRDEVLGRAIPLIGRVDADLAIALAAELPEETRPYVQGELAVNLARSSPEKAMHLVREHSLDEYYIWIGDDYGYGQRAIWNAVHDHPGVALKAALELEREGRISYSRSGDRFFVPEIIKLLPQRTGDWMPDLLANGSHDEYTSYYLRNLLAGCPWPGGEDGAAAIAVISDSAMQAEAAEAWACRWATVDREAARAWAESLPPAARARALCGLWEKGQPAGDLLQACEAAGTVPDALLTIASAAPEETASWVAAQPAASHTEIAMTAGVWADTDPAAAAEWAAALPDPRPRFELTDRRRRRGPMA